MAGGARDEHASHRARARLAAPGISVPVRDRRLRRRAARALGGALPARARPLGPGGAHAAVPLGRRNGRARTPRLRHRCASFSCAQPPIASCPNSYYL